MNYFANYKTGQTYTWRLGQGTHYKRDIPDSANTLGAVSDDPTFEMRLNGKESPKE